ncbi:MAG: hypothetical protein P8188_09905 [Gemmatimonadota bacterium]
MAYPFEMSISSVIRSSTRSADPTGKVRVSRRHAASASSAARRPSSSRPAGKVTSKWVVVRVTQSVSGAICALRGPATDRHPRSTRARRAANALEQARREPTQDRILDLGRKLSAFRRGGQGADDGETADRDGDGRARDRDEDDGSNWLLATAGGALVATLLKGWPARGEPGPALVARAAAAGAAAAVLVALGRDFVRGERSLDMEDVPDRLLSGAARGLIFGAVVEPRLPGPPILNGAIWGGAEFLLSPLGGLGRLLGRHTTYGRLPVVQGVLNQDAGSDDADLVESLVFGVALALMAGSTER